MNPNYCIVVFLCVLVPSFAMQNHTGAKRFKRAKMEKMSVKPNAYSPVILHMPMEGSGKPSLTKMSPKPDADSLSILFGGPGKSKKRIKRVKRAKMEKMRAKPNADAPAILYLPLGGSGKPQCLPAAGAKLAQLVPMMFAGMTFTIFDAVATVANNINSNNNNLNDQNINFQMSSNTVVTGNVNVANQINIMNMAGRKKRAAHLAKQALDYMAKYNTLAAVTPELMDRGHEMF